MQFILAIQHLCGYHMEMEEAKRILQFLKNEEGKEVKPIEENRGFNQHKIHFEHDQTLWACTVYIHVLVLTFNFQTLDVLT